jgi:hypothetical protein
MPPSDIRQMCQVSRANDLSLMEPYAQVGDEWMRTGLCKQTTRTWNVEGCRGSKKMETSESMIRFGPVDSARLGRPLWA